MKTRTRAIPGAIIVLAVFSVLWFWLSTTSAGANIFVEHGPMENFQAICIALGFFIFLGQIRSTRPPQRLLVCALATFYLTFVVVEFDTRELGWRTAALILNGPVRNVWLVGLWILLCLWALRHRRPLLQTGWQWLWSPSGWLLMGAGVFWLVAGAVDKLKLFSPPSRNLLVEELLESNAALLMLVAAVATVRWSIQPAPSPMTTGAAELPKPQDSGQ
jgi:hypothetical protein